MVSPRREWQSNSVFLPEKPYGQYEKEKKYKYICIYIYMTLEDEALRSEAIQYAIREEQREITNSFRKNEAAGPRRSDIVVDMSDGESPML